MNVLVVSAHPNDDSFTARVRDRAIAALRRAGHHVRHTDLYAEGFDPRLSRAEWLAHRSDPDDKVDVARHAADLRWARALVFVYPTWWSGPPSILKGWIDRVWIEGVAYTLPEGSARVRAGLRNIRRLVVITGHGSSWQINWLEGQTGRLLVMRSLRALCHPLARRRWLAIYRLDRAGDVEREAFATRVERAMARL